MERERKAVDSLRNHKAELLRELELVRKVRAVAEATANELRGQFTVMTERASQASAEISAVLLEVRQEMTCLPFNSESAKEDAALLREQVATLQSQFAQLPSAKSDRPHRGKQ